jgi:hypothetical protein
MSFEVDRTRALFEQGRALVPRIPGALAVDIDLFSRGGLAVLDRIEVRGFDVLSGRPALTQWTKIGLLGRALVGLGMARIGGRRRTARSSSISAAVSQELAITSSTAPRPLESPR